MMFMDRPVVFGYAVSPFSPFLHISTSPDSPLLCLSPFPSPQQASEASEAISTIGTRPAGMRHLLTVYYHSKLAVSLFAFSPLCQQTTVATLSIGMCEYERARYSQCNLT